MHNLEVVLVLTSPDIVRPGQSKLLLIQQDGKYHLPTASIGEQESSLQVAAKLLCDLTQMRARILGVGYVDLVPCPLADSVERKLDGVRVIGVPYGAMLPGEIVPLTDSRAKWVGLLEAFQSLDGDDLEILQGACNKI